MPTREVHERAALPQLGDTVAGKYRVERVIGSGGMSVVFGAMHLVTGKRFALKWLAPMVDNDLGESAQRFIREAQVAGRFQHPNVVEVYDVGQTHDGAHYMVMEWLEGEALSTRLERTGPLSVNEACECLLPCMRAIDDAHAAGIVHRDLKPANIFICKANKHGPERVKVLDFGIAKLVSHTPGEFNPFVTKTGTLIGTPYYLAPEQLRHLPVDARTDVYACGVILYQLLTGKLPFSGNNFAELVLQIATGTPVPVRESVPLIASGVEEVITRAMAREPAQRFQNLRGLIEALEAAREEGARLETPAASQSVAGQGEFSASTAAHGQVRWARWGLAAAVCAGAGLLIGWYVTKQPADPAMASPRSTTVTQAATARESAAAVPERTATAPAARVAEGTVAAPDATAPPTPPPSAAGTPADALPVGVSPPEPAPPLRRSKLRARATAAAAPGQAAAAPEDDHNPLHMKIQ